MTLSTHEERVIAELETQFRSDQGSQRFERGNRTVAAQHSSKRAQRLVPVIRLALLLLAIALLSVGRLDWFALRISAPLGLAMAEVQRISVAAGSVIVLCSLLMLGRAVRNLRGARGSHSS